MKAKRKGCLAPGVYTVQIDRTRKVRGKDALRLHMTILETGQKITETLCPDPKPDL